MSSRDPDGTPQTSGFRTWNDPERIRAHRAMAPRERLRLTLEASRATLRFERGRRRDG